MCYLNVLYAFHCQALQTNKKREKLGNLLKKERWSSQPHNPTNHSVLKPVLQWGVGVMFDHLNYWVSEHGHHSKENWENAGIFPMT